MPDKRKRGRQKLSREYLIKKLKEAYQILNKPPTEKELRELGCPSRNAYRNEFSNMIQAKIEAGIPIKEKLPVGKGARGISAGMRFKILHRDGFRCQYCGATPQTGNTLHIDHIIPVRLGGKTTKVNLITACSVCNRGKWTMKLTTLPRKQRPEPKLPERQRKLFIIKS